MGKISHVLPLEAGLEAVGNKQIMFTLKVNLSRTINKLQREIKMIDKLPTEIIPFHSDLPLGNGPTVFQLLKNVKFEHWDSLR